MQVLLVHHQMVVLQYMTILTALIEILRTFMEHYHNEVEWLKL